jgi:hypothetical protein
LGLRWRQQVQLVTATLAVTSSFERKQARCCTCDEVKQVTSAKDILRSRGVVSDQPRQEVMGC